MRLVIALEDGNSRDYLRQVALSLGLACDTSDCVLHNELPVRMAQGNDYAAWVPFGCTVGVILMGFYGLAYSLFPYLVVDRITIWEAASAPESLMVILVGALVVLPAILGYTVYVYRVFRGKAGPLSCG